jgi:vanillate O-demethylase ferredoxin subunit
MIRVRVADVADIADSIKLYELEPLSGSLPPFKAGAHIDLHLGNGLKRSYSLVNDESERHRYCIAVALDRATRGGSRFIHDSIRPGEVLDIEEPTNSFALVESAANSVLIAGGVGITPIMPMIGRLHALQRPWQLHYCVRTRTAAAFARELSQHGDRVNLLPDDQTGGAFLDIPALMADAPPETHFYCCGPAGMLDGFQKAGAELAPGRFHLEFFAPREAAATDNQFTVVLARSERSFVIPRGATILETLLAAGIDVDHDCTQGICGTCETRVLEGIPDHRDEILTESERAASKTMMICCSGSKSPTLVLDL